MRPFLFPAVLPYNGSFKIYDLAPMSSVNNIYYNLSSKMIPSVKHKIPDCW